MGARSIRRRRWLACLLAGLLSRSRREMRARRQLFLPSELVWPGPLAPAEGLPHTHNWRAECPLPSVLAWLAREPARRCAGRPSKSLVQSDSHFFSLSFYYYYYIKSSQFSIIYHRKLQSTSISSKRRRQASAQLSPAAGSSACLSAVFMRLRAWQLNGNHRRRRRRRNTRM